MTARKGGTLLAALKPSWISVLGGSLAFYLVSTSLLTVRRTVPECRTWITGFMLMGLSIGVLGFYYGHSAAISVRGTLQGIPPVGYFLFGSVALLGAALDTRVLRAGHIEGNQRLARHLWRMGLAMFIATASFFLGQAKVIPQPLRNFALLSIPVVLVVLHVLYWLARVLLSQRRARMVAAASQ
jgi:peptidoglycan/LPS O-acetylase OafA/YrhL